MLPSWSLVATFTSTGSADVGHPHRSGRVYQISSDGLFEFGTKVGKDLCYGQDVSPLNLGCYILNLRFADWAKLHC